MLMMIVMLMLILLVMVLMMTGDQWWNMDDTELVIDLEHFVCFVFFEWG
jgi:hypothetical protein